MSEPLPRARSAGLTRASLLCGGVTCGVLVSCAAAAGGRIPAAIILAAASSGADEADAGVERVFLPKRRSAARQFRKAEQLIEAGKYTDAVEFLSAILAGDEDWFFETGRSGATVGSLKAHARRLVGQLPREGREIYELRFGAPAEKRLLEAATNGNLDGIADVSRRYFHTRAGYEATWLLGYSHLDQGRPLAAALCFQQLQETPRAARLFEPSLSVIIAGSLLRAGRPDEARDVLEDLRARYPDEVVQAGRRTSALADLTGDPLQWLADTLGPVPQWGEPQGEAWNMFRGDAARNAASHGGRPLLRPLWRVRTVNHPTVEKIVEQMKTTLISQGSAVVPSLHPVATNDVILMRTAQNLVAVDARTGKLRWEWNDDQGNDYPRLVNAIRDATPGSQSALLGFGLQYRLWGDATYGSLATDGQRVILVTGLEFVTGSVGRRVVFQGGNTRGGWRGPQTDNRLVALDLRGKGQQVWEAGGPECADPELADAFFLGPPLVLDDRLYVLAEIKSGIRLVVLDAATGRMAWSQQLLDLELNIAQNPVRRLAGATPSFADGVLVCPTSGGAVVAVDLSRRTLLWAYRYPQRFHHSAGSLNLLRRRRSRGFESAERWVDGAVTLAEGRALLTPAESNELHCLGIDDGQVQWRADRGDSLYLACVFEGRVIVVGRNSVSALRIDDGAPAWPDEMPLPDGTLPSGRGFRSGHHYYLPLSSGEVVTVDLQQGEIVERARPHKGNVPGNLICHNDMVISQGADYLQSYQQFATLKQHVRETLANDPDDPEALARRAEIALEEGRRSDAIGDLTRSFELEPGELTRQLLVENMLEALREDFAAHRHLVPTLEQLADEPELRTTFLWLVADGFQRVDLFEDAFDAYLRLVDEELPYGEMIEVESDWAVRADRLIRARLTQLRSQVSDDQMARMDKAIFERLQATGKDATSVQLQQFLRYFGSHRAAHGARLQLAERLMDRDEALMCERQLRILQRTGREPQRRAAVALMAQLMARQEHWDRAAPFIRELEGPLADEVCLEGLTGGALADALRRDAQDSEIAGQKTDWPKGRVEVSTSSAGRRTKAPRRRHRVRLEGPVEPFFEGVSVSVDQNFPQAIVGHDSYGGQRFYVPLDSSNAQRRDYFANYRANHAVVSGHLLLISTGHQILAVDTLRRAGPGWENVLWRHDIIEPIAVASQNRAVRPQRVDVPGQLPRYEPVDTRGRPVGVLGPILSHGVAFQRAETLVFVDLITGDTLWERRGLPAARTLFGDDERLFVVPISRGGDPVEAIVLNALDGSLLGRRRVAPLRGMTQRIATKGALVLQWSDETTSRRLALVDPWQQRELWSHSFARNSTLWRLGDDAVGVMDRQGHFVLLDIDTGQASIDQQLEAEPELAGIYLLESRDQVFLITSVPAPQKNGRSVSPIPAGFENPLVTGRVYAFDRGSGQPQWPVPARIEQRCLPLEQPRDLPVLAFLQQVTQREVIGQRRARTTVKTSLLCLDKRTGRAVCDERQLNPTGGVYAVVAHPEQATVTFTLASSEVTLSWTDEPVAPEPPWQSGGAESAAARRGLVDLLRMTLIEIQQATEVRDAGQPPE